MFSNWLHIGRSHSYKIFEANTLPELTAEQYKVLLLTEFDRVEAEKKVRDEMKRRQRVFSRGRSSSDGRTMSVRTKR